MVAQSGEYLNGGGASSCLERAIIFGGRGGFDESFFDEELVHLGDGGLEELWIHVEVKKAMAASLPGFDSDGGHRCRTRWAALRR